VTAEADQKLGLILAGGGLKVAFQAGVLQVWLDEAGLEFDVADGASGGVFNLAMWCQGMSGTEIADAWRRTKPWKFLEPNPLVWRSLVLYGRFRRNIVRKTWGLDWNRIRRTGKEATFNVFNATDQALVVLPAARMNEDFFIACVSLPMWFPPVAIDGKKYIDAVYATDANLRAAIKGGATELWVIWTVSTRGRWRNGFVNQYFQIIEAAANSRLEELERQIEASNAAIAAGGAGEFDHHVTVRKLSAEVPLHYVLVFRSRPLREAVELGVQAARAWCAENGIALKPPAPKPAPGGARVRFTETMVGRFTIGATDPEEGGANGSELEVSLTVATADLERFLDDPSREMSIAGSIHSEAFGGTLDVKGGVFNLFVPPTSQRRKMQYRVFFDDGVGHPLTLVAEKRIPGLAGARPWRDTTTCYLRILQGYVEDGAADEASIVGAGVIRITFPRFLRQLCTFRGGLRSIARFQTFFVSQCVDLYLLRR